MKNKNVRRFLLFTLINLVVIGGVLLLVAQKPKVLGVHRIELLEKRNDSLQVKLELIIENGNFFSISSDDVVIRSFSGETLLGEGKMTELNLGSGVTDTVPVYIMLASDAFLKAYEGSRDDFQNSLEVSGSFWPLFFVNSFTVEQPLEGEQMNQLLLASFFDDNEITFDSLNYTPVNAVESRMDFNVTLTNTFGFDFKVRELELDILPAEGSQTVIGHWKLTEEIDMKPKNPIVLPGSLTVHHMALMLAGLEKQGKNLNKGWVTGHVIVDTGKEPFRIPFAFEVTSDMSKLMVNKDSK